MGKVVSLLELKLRSALEKQSLPEEEFTPLSDDQIQAMVASREWWESVFSETQIQQLDTLRENWEAEANVRAFIDRTETVGEGFELFSLDRVIHLFSRIERGQLLFSAAEMKLLKKLDEHHEEWIELRNKWDKADEARELEDEERAVNFTNWLMSDLF